MALGSYISFGILLLVVVSKHADALRCLECVDMPDPSDCNIVTECSSIDKCYVEQVVSSGGRVLYNLGCQSKVRCADVKKRSLEFFELTKKRQSTEVSNTDVQTCVECCDGDGCNMNGCGTSMKPISQRGPKCYVCHAHEAMDSCREIAECDLDEECALYHPHAHPYWVSMCIKKKSCPTIVSLLGRRRDLVDHCPRCCEDDFCNDSCYQNITTTVQTTHAPAPTHPPTTHRTTKPTTHPTTKPTTHATHHHTHPPTTKPTTKPTTHQHTHHAVTHPTTHRTHATHPTTKPTTKPTTHATHHHTHPPTTKPTTKPTTHPTTHPTTKPTTPGTTSDPQVACELDNYEYDPGTQLCLRFESHLNLNWSDAQLLCQQEKGQLAVITTDEKTRDIAHFISKGHFSNVKFWVGATDVSQNHVFTWTDGTHVVFNDNEKHDLTDANCLLLTGHNVNSFDVCSAKHAFICERNNSIRP